MRANGVEIAEQRDPQLRVCLAAVRQDLLDKEFGISVGIRGGKQRVLPDRDGSRIAVYRSGGGKHEFFDAVRPHSLQQHQRAAQIVGIVLQRFPHAFPYRFQRREVHYSVNGGELLKNFLYRRRITQIRLHKGDRLSRDLLHPAHRLPAGIHQIVRHDHIVSRFYQLHAGMAAHIPGTAGH